MTALFYFGCETLSGSTTEIIWKTPVSHLLLLLRLKELVEDPKTAFAFSDEEFIAKIKKLGL